MLRLVLFFLCALVLTSLLREVPVVGAIFRVPILGFWVSAILLSVIAARWADRAVSFQRRRRFVRDLGVVDTPANRGKLGAYLVSEGRAKDALPHLVAAREGEPERNEWAYRLGEAQLANGDAAAARATLDGLLARDEEHAYGRALWMSAEAARAAGDPTDALGRLDRHQRNHGPTAEASYTRGLALRSLGRRDEARAAFREVGRLAASNRRLGGGTPRSLIVRAWLAGLV